MLPNASASSRSDSGLRVVTFIMLAFLACGITAARAGLLPSLNWVPAWTASPQPLDPTTIPDLKNRTLRLIVHTTVGGSQLRIRLSNAFGTQPLTIGDAHVAIASSSPAAIVPGSDQALTFGGQATVTIPVGALVVSDSVNFQVSALSNLTISLYLPQDTTSSRITEHTVAEQISYVSPAAGDLTGAISIPSPTSISNWFYLTGVEVVPLFPAFTVVALGDSITDGEASTLNANNRWTDLLATNLKTLLPFLAFPIANQGISGNALLGEYIGSNALERFDRDVLSQAGAKYVIVEEGLNDIGASVNNPSLTVSANQLIFGLNQLIQRGHEQGLKVFLATLTPIQGSIYYTTSTEATRQAVNLFIRSSGAADAVLDFDQAVRDPNKPAQLLAAFDSGDHLHPNDAGYQAMANSINWTVFLSFGF